MQRNSLVREASVEALASRPPAPQSTAGSVGAGPQRRADPRFSTLGRAARIDALGVSGLCRVLNLSDHGAAIETSASVACGDPVRLWFDSENIVQGRVAWCRGNRIGIRFLTPIESFPMIRKIASDRWSGVARPPRLSAAIVAIVSHDTQSFGTVIDNVSEAGFCVRHPGCLSTGAQIETTTAKGLRMRGTVRWANNVMAGIELSGKLTTAQLSNTTDL